MSDSTFLTYPENYSEGNKSKMWGKKYVLFTRLYFFSDMTIGSPFICIFSVNINQLSSPHYTTQTASSI